MAGELQFALRMPGQYEDEETGWHDNLLRTYVPDAGHYLEPDPLGPLPGTDTYGYARQQPWRYADPHDLFEAIERKDFPRWTMYVQIMPEKDAGCSCM